MQDKEMINDLIQESREHLQEIEPVLLEFEKKCNDISTEKINQIFRAVHSIKGGFGFFGFKQVTSLAHSMEFPCLTYMTPRLITGGAKCSFVPSVTLNELTSSGLPSFGLMRPAIPWSL